MKVAPIMEELNRSGFEQVLVHTGQHYDYKMSRLFFDELGLPRPHINLEVGSGTHAVQTGEIMKNIEPVFIREKPDIVLVVGDVNSTLACALTACKLKIPVAHVEAGLRSFDRSMPEEINRVLTDAISDLLFTSEECAEMNLKREGISQEKIFFIGNTMIDTLMKYREKARSMPVTLNGFDIRSKPYGVMTLHRPSNVENKENLYNIMQAVGSIAQEMPIIFPVHPRTFKGIKNHNLDKLFSNPYSRIERGMYAIDPLGYLEFLCLMMHAKIMFTDSGGIQEETTFLDVPCITLRNNTERPVTLSHGSNILTGPYKDKIVEGAHKWLNGYKRRKEKPQFWDGKAAQRIARHLIRHFEQ
jgi:UDP-N-acetylglucosamine 2-epimerase (non-hydrolysing)